MKTKKFQKLSTLNKAELESIKGGIETSKPMYGIPPRLLYGVFPLYGINPKPELL